MKKKIPCQEWLVPFRNNIIHIKFRSRCLSSAPRKKDKRRLAEAGTFGRRDGRAAKLRQVLPEVPVRAPFLFPPSLLFSH